MIDILEARITSDNKCMIIEALILDLEYFDNVTIKKVAVDTQKTYSTTGPSSDAKIVYSDDFDDFEVRKDSYKRHIRLEIPLKDLSILGIDTDINNLYFVYVYANTDTQAELAPCECKENPVITVITNLYDVYQNLIGGVKQVALTCEIPKDFINNYLQLQAVNTSLKTGNYLLAIKYWNKFFVNSKEHISNHKPCGCHGTF